MTQTSVSESRPDERITREDIEDKVREIQSSVTGGVEQTKPTLLAGGIVVTLVVLFVVFWFGKRQGNRKKTVVEVRRI